MILMGHTEIGEARISRLFAIECQIERVGVEWSGVEWGRVWWVRSSPLCSLDALLPSLTALEGE
jgi:hypothetical protein